METTTRVKSWREKNPEKRKAQKRRENDRRFCKKHNIPYDDYILDRDYYKDLVGYKLSPENKIKQHLLENAKERATIGNYPCTITRDDIVLNEFCPYLGIKLNYPNKGSHDNANHSLDKIDPKLGYVKGNIQVISHLANTMKNCATPDQLLTFAKNVISIHG